MRRWLLASALGGLTALVPLSASAALLWTLVASPLTAVANQSTAFTFTATNLDPLQVLGCLEVDLPGSFLIQGTGTPTANNGDIWVSTVSGQVVTVHSTNGGGRLKLAESVIFTIQAQPTVAGPFTLPNHSHRRDDCAGAGEPGVALAITVLPGATPTPLPTPSPKPTPIPTPRPTPTTPTSTEPLPSTLPTTPPIHGETAAGASPRASASPTASRSAEPGAGAGPSGGGPSAGGSVGGAAAVRLEPQELKLNTELFDILRSPQVWFVPAAAIGAPGLLVLLWVTLQTVGTLAWIPSVRRMRGQERRRSARSRRVAAR